MINFEFQDIDFENIASWPLYFKAVVLIVSMIIVYFICNWFFISSKIEHLVSLKDEEQRQRVFFVSKQNSLFDIKDYKKQIETIETRLAKLTRKLPGVNEVPNLINQISQAGLASNLSIKEMKILPEKKFKYYVELPIKIRVQGDYHQFGDFISKVSNMPRVITFHDLNLEWNNPKKDVEQKKLEMEILAKTYRYLGASLEEDLDDNGKGNKDKKPKNKS